MEFLESNAIFKKNSKVDFENNKKGIKIILNDYLIKLTTQLEVLRLNLVKMFSLQLKIKRTIKILDKAKDL